MKRVLFRADGSSQLGMGHLARCLAFATALKGMDIDSLFVARAPDATVRAFIESMGMRLVAIPADLTLEEDALRTLGVAREFDPSLVVADVCHAESLRDPARLSAFHASLLERYPLVVLAGGESIDWPASVLVSPYFRVEYPTPRIHLDCVRLLGPSYFIFREEFIAAARVPRAILPEARRILLTIGGGDPSRLSTKAVRALGLIFDGRLEVRIIAGPAFTAQGRQEIDDAVAALGRAYSIVEPGSSLAQQMLWADLAITGDGLTKYETAVTGTPSIMLSRAGSERALNEQFVQAGTVVHVEAETVEISDLAAEIEIVLRDAGLRQAMSDRGKRMVDGRGLDRIIGQITDMGL